MKNFRLLLPFALAIVLSSVACSEDDSSSNSSDKTPPTLFLNGDNAMNLSLNSNYTEFGADATDNVDGVISSQVQISGFVNTNKAGFYAISYDVQDRAGNSAETLVRFISVTNDADRLKGVYTASYKCGSTANQGNFTTQITTSETVNNQFTISKVEPIDVPVQAMLQGIDVLIPNGVDNNNMKYSGVGTAYDSLLTLNINTESSNGFRKNCDYTLRRY